MELHWLERRIHTRAGAPSLHSALPVAACLLAALSMTLTAQTYPGAPYPQGGAAPQGVPQQAGAEPVDEPGRAVARLGILNGDASIRRGDSNDWVAAAINAPLMSGDEISVGAGSRAEVQIDEAHFLRIAGDTELRLADLENGHYQVQISHGLVTWRVLRASQAHPDISTPLVSVQPGPLSLVRVEVSQDGTTHVTVRHGEATVSTQKGSEQVGENSTMDIRGSANDPEFQVVAAPARDEWDGWSDQRDSYLARAQAPRYVPQGEYGVEDLDPYGHWAYDPAYGWVWMPTVAPSWAPYQNGQWVWEDYYGWTWIDYAPWGWTPFHYGSWYMRPGLGWAWFPGPRVGRVWWRPAMVGFFGWGGGVGIGIGFGFGNIGWIPLAPYEAFRPWYGRGGFGGGAIVSVNIARNANIIGTFRNASVAGGVTAVTASDFQRGNFRSPIAVDRATLQQASLVRGAVPVTPTSSNLRFSNRASATPTARTAGQGAASQRFFGSSPAAQRTPFARQQAAIRSAVSGQASAAAGRSSAGAGMRSGGSAPAQSSAPGWQRFQGNASGVNAGAAGSRGPEPGAAGSGYNRFSGTPGAANGSQSAPRAYQVSPSIMRQRSEAPAQSYGGGTQARPQQAPAPAGGYGGYGGGAAARSAPAPRSAPAGGGGHSAPSRSGGRR